MRPLKFFKCHHEFKIVSHFPTLVVLHCESYTLGVIGKTDYIFLNFFFLFCEMRSQLCGSCWPGTQDSSASASLSWDYRCGNLAIPLTRDSSLAINQTNWIFCGIY